MKQVKKDRFKLAVCERLQRIAAKLHMGPSTLATMEFELLNADGSQAYKMSAKSNSFVRNYYNLVAALTIFKLPGNPSCSAAGVFGDGVDTPIKFTTAALAFGSYSQASVMGYHPVSGNLHFGYYYGGGAYDTSGIVVGLSDAAESFDAYSLTSKVAHGNGVNQLQYGAGQSTPLFGYDAATKKLTAAHVRAFTNASAASVVIKEIGLYSGIKPYNAAGVALLIRDVIPEGITIAPGQTLNVTYNLSQIMSN